MERYTWRELRDMHFVYGAAEGNSRRAQRMYRERYPVRRCPHYRTFTAIHDRLGNTGTFLVTRSNAGRPRTVRTCNFEEEVLLRIERNPETSTRAIATELGVHHSLVWNVLREQLLHPYRPMRVQAMGPDDYPHRLEFVRWFLHQTNADPRFPEVVLFTDEAQFTRDGMYNSHNSHLWLDENPHATVMTNHQRRFAVNIWAGIVGDYLLGPYMLPPRLRWPMYRLFLEVHLPILLEDVPLRIRRRMWFQHDGAPPHFADPVRVTITNTFGNRWIGRGGPVNWPARSPDLSPLDFFLWGYMKTEVYSSPVESEMELVQRIHAAAINIQTTPYIFQRTRDSLRRRYQLCNEVNGAHFEHLL